MGESAAFFEVRLPAAAVLAGLDGEVPRTEALPAKLMAEALDDRAWLDTPPRCPSFLLAPG